MAQDGSDYRRSAGSRRAPYDSRNHLDASDSNAGEGAAVYPRDWQVHDTARQQHPPDGAHYRHHPQQQQQYAEVADNFYPQQQPPVNMEHQWACESMGLSVPPIPESAYMEMSEAGYDQQQAYHHDDDADARAAGGGSRKRRVASTSIDYSEPSSEPEDLDTSSVSTANVKATRRPKKAKAVSKKKRDTRKRFAWPEDLHKDFVSAIFATGLKQYVDDAFHPVVASAEC
jgi:hypothetical protein